MSAIEPSLPTLPHYLPGLDAKRHFVEDTLADIQVIKRIVDDRRSESPEGDAVAIDPRFVSVVKGEEPIVTRKELWSYYRELLNTS